jgi:uncharacterized protein
MKNKKIILAGGNGFLGAGLIDYFGEDNDIVVLTRSKNMNESFNNAFGFVPSHTSRVTWIHWDGQTLSGWEQTLEHADILINLAGKTVNCRYTEVNKKAILDSRVNATNALANAVKGLSYPPSLWINVASATYYSDARQHPMDEFTGQTGTTFSEQVCQTWEGTFNQIALPATRKAILRMAIVLGPGSALIPLLNLVKTGMGGPQGDGNQMVSWVHLQDVCRMIPWLYEHPEQAGTFNCSAPHAVTNRAFMESIRQVTNTPIGLPMPTWLLKLGTRLIGTEPELVLKSRWVAPTRLSQAGFTFDYPHLLPALQQIIAQLPRRRYKLV